VIIEYTAEGSETREVLDARRLRASEVQIVERTADMKWVAVKQGLREGDVTSVRTVAWVLKRRDNPTLRLSEFDPYDDELVVRLDQREVAEFAVKLFATYKDEPEQLSAAWDELREAAFDKAACELAIKEAQAPKDPAPAQELTAVPTDGSETAA
jgi:hypothetical protein